MNISGQAFDTLGALLHLLADPKAYEEQMNALRMTIEENKRFVELVAPAGEIMNLLEEQRKHQADAKSVVAKAEVEAEAVRKAAQHDAEQTRSAANQDAAAVLARAQEVQEQARADAVSAKEQRAAVAAAKKAEAEHLAKVEQLTALNEVLANERDEVLAIKETVSALRSELAAKLDKIREL